MNPITEPSPEPVTFSSHFTTYYPQLVLLFPYHLYSLHAVSISP